MRIWKGYLWFLLALPPLCVTLQSTATAGECIYPGQCNSSINSTVACHTCRDGYVKDPLDDTKCASVNVTASLLIASDNGVEEIAVKELNNTTPQLHYEGSTSSLEYSFQKKILFWFSYSDKKLYAGPVNKKASENSTVVAHDDGSGIRSISYDWIHGNLYWTDIYKDEISVSNKNWKYKKVLIKDGLKFPSSIVVNPLNGWIHWADVFLQHIERAAMDGTRREVIISTDINYPRGLTLDFGENRIYWTQNEPSSIFSSNFDGSDRKLIFTADEQQFSNSYFKSITTFENTLYWIDRKTVFSVNKCNGENLAVVYDSESDLNDIKVYDASRQLPGENICKKRIDECSHFCFPVPSPRYDSIFSRCDCPDGLRVSIDGNNCVRY